MITSILDKRFYQLADRYIPLLDDDGNVQPYEEYFYHKIQNLGKDEFFIPVLGVQGTGKSSFLNALLMDDIVLPVDADETTCIPVEIRFSMLENGKIEVYFNGKSQATPIHEPKELEQYVHNTYNYGNEKNVSHIVVYKNSEILKKGVVFVDLPGVSSLTHQNMKTTMNYIEKLSAAIFMLRTVPPITRSEKVFLSTVWPKLTKAWFIQNQWNDESKREVEEGLEYNKNVLQQIAQQHHTKEDIKIQIVNVYQALLGRLDHRDDLIKDSGLENVVKFISEMTTVWKTTLSEKVTEDIKILLIRLRRKLEEKLEDVQLERRDLRKKFREQERLLDDMISENQYRISQIKTNLNKQEFEIRNFSDQKSRIQAENLRNEMRRITGSRVLDGERLTTAFIEVQRDLATDVLEELNLKLQEMKKKIEVDLGELQFQDTDGSFTNFAKFYKEEAFKFEKGLASGISVAGSLGGAWAGVEIGGAIGTAVGGPLGTVIGGVAGGIIGIGISLFSGWLGKKSKDLVQNQRGKASMQDLERPIQAFQENLRESITEQIDSYTNTIQLSLKKFIENQELELDHKREEHRKDMNLSEDEIAERRQQIKEDIAYLGSLEVGV